MKCECQQWASSDISLILNGNGHHENCPHYRKPTQDLTFEIFGKLVWDKVREIGPDIFECEFSNDLFPLAKLAGLADYVEYDPQIHVGIDADPGDMIWVWGDLLNSGAHRSSEQSSAVSWGPWRLAGDVPESEINRADTQEWACTRGVR